MKNLLSKLSILFLLTNLATITLSVYLYMSLTFKTPIAEIFTIAVLIIINIVWLLFTIKTVRFYYIDNDKLFVYGPLMKNITIKKNIVKCIKIKKMLIFKQIAIMLDDIDDLPQTEVDVIEKYKEYDSINNFYKSNHDKIIFLPYNQKLYSELVKFNYINNV